MLNLLTNQRSAKTNIITFISISLLILFPLFVNATPTPSPSPSPSPTPTPTPSPTPSPTPTPTPTSPSSDDPIPGLAITKTDNQDITRPGHTLTYTIEVTNTGDVLIEDVVVTDTVPSTIKVTDISNDGSQSGSVITWPEFALAEGETITLFVAVTTAKATSCGSSLVNVSQARSADKGLATTDTDTTIVECTSPQILAATTKDVPVTAKTGAGTLAIISTLLGGTGLIATLKRFWT